MFTGLLLRPFDAVAQAYSPDFMIGALFMEDVRFPRIFSPLPTIGLPLTRWESNPFLRSIALPDELLIFKIREDSNLLPIDEIQGTVYVATAYNWLLPLHCGAIGNPRLVCVHNYSCFSDREEFVAYSLV